MNDPVDGERLRRAWGALAEDGGPAVDDEAIWRAAAGEASPEERQAVVDEVARNPAAAESWRLAMALQRELAESSVAEQDSADAAARVANPPQGPDTETTATPIPWRRRAQRHFVGWAAAAGIILATGLGLWTGIGSDEPPTYRDSNGVEGSAIVSLVSETEPQPRDEVVLCWSAPEGSRFSLRLFDSDLDLLLTLEDLSSPEVRLPTERLTGVPDGARLLWQVEAHTPKGGVITSPTFFLELSAPDAPATDPATRSTAPQNP